MYILGALGIAQGRNLPSYIPYGIDHIVYTV